MGDNEKTALELKPWVYRDPKTIPYRGERPIEMDTTPVKVRGEALHPVWWRGRQWAATEHGIECLDGTYTIAARRLTANVETYVWPLHMGTKDWVDSDDFATAWMVALALHGVGHVDPQAAREAIKRGVLRE
jgi:hypothetical protein